MANKDFMLDRLAFLKEVPLLAQVNDGVLAYLADDFRERTYRKGETLFHQGDESQALYILKKGKVRIFHLSPSGEETTVNIFTRRQLIGEFALIDGQPRSATAKAITACTLLVMSRDRCLHHLENIPGLALAMCRQLIYKLRWTSQYAETIVQYDIAGRLLHFLLHYNEEFGQEVAPGQYELDLGLNQNDLASLVGAKRGWVNTILQDWRKRDLVEFERGKITLLDLDRVRQERDGRIKMSEQ